MQQNLIQLSKITGYSSEMLTVSTIATYARSIRGSQHRIQNSQSAIIPLS